MQTGEINYPGLYLSTTLVATREKKLHKNILFSVARQRPGGDWNRTSLHWQFPETGIQSVRISTMEAKHSHHAGGCIKFHVGNWRDWQKRDAVLSPTSVPSRLSEQTEFPPLFCQTLADLFVCIHLYCRLVTLVSSFTKRCTILLSRFG